MKEQKILLPDNDYKEIDDYLLKNKVRKIFLVCGSSIKFFKIKYYFETIESRFGIKVTIFSDFQQNPLYESVVEGVKLFHESNCDIIVGVGGGSAIDVAKCIKLYSNMNENKNYLKQQIIPNDIKLLAIPTTAGTGSEATRYAVIYYNGEKQSVMDWSCIPSAILMDASVLKTLPMYQRKSTMLDALCHAIESFWSINSTEESKNFSRQAISLIMENMKLYLNNDEIGNENMLKAAYLAGKAINIAQTTAGHAMCYKLTSLYGIAHGHAAALCVSKIWPMMLKNINKCIDLRGEIYLKKVFDEISDAMGCHNSEKAIEKFQSILEKLQLEVPIVNSIDDFEMLRYSVNPIRLKNHPIQLDQNFIDIVYWQILK